MYKKFSYIIFTFFSAICLNAQQRVVAECTINYAIILDSTQPSNNTTKTVYIKGNDSRIDIVSPSFSQTTFYDKNSGNAVVLREFGNNKVITKLSKSQWIEKNKKYLESNISFNGDTKIILGYECKSASILTKDSSVINVFYATSIITSVKEFEYQFKDIPGLVLEYEIEEGKQKIKYLATKINLSPVSTSKFDVPTAGYRMLN